MEGRGRGQLGRVLEGFANAVLERALPRVRQLLAARLGEGAELDALELDGARVHLVDLHLPLGSRASLHASRATFLTRTEDLVAGLPGLRLERMEGVLEVLGAEPIRGRVTFEPVASPSIDAWVDGSLAVHGLTLAGTRYSGDARVRITSTRFAVERVQLSGDEAALAGDASGSFSAGSFELERASVSMCAIDVGVVDHALSTLGIELGAIRSVVDASARASGSAALEHGRIAGALSIRAQGGAAELTLDGEIGDDGALSGALRGRLDPAILHAGRAWLQGDEIAIEGTLGGSARRPAIAIEARAPELAVAGLTLTRARLSLTHDAAGLTIEGRARSGPGAIVMTRAPSGRTRIKIERAALAPVIELARQRVAPRTLEIATRLGLDRGQLWLDASYEGGAWEGVLHAESEHARVTLDPLRVRDRALDGTSAHIIASARALASELPSLVREVDGALELALDVSHASLATPRSAHARGTIRARRVALSIGDRAELAVSDAFAELTLESGALRIEGARAGALGGTITGAAMVSWDSDRPRVIVTELALEGLRDRRALATLLDLDAQIELDGALAREGGALRGTLRARTGGSDVTVRAVVSDEGSLHGSELEGTLAVHDLARWTEGWSVMPHDAIWQLAGRIEGSLRSPRAELDARCAQQRVRVAGVDLDGYDLALRARLTRQRMVWSALEARGYGGVLRSRGTLVRASAMSAHLAVEGVDVARLPLPRGSVAEHLEGTLSGTLDLFRPAGGATIGRGRARVDAPVYRLIERARGTAERLGLPMPDPIGTAALTAEVRLSADAWRASDLVARLSRLSVRGDLSLHRHGPLAGRLVLRPDPEWLRESTYLAAVAELLTEIPLDVSGTVGSPRVSADPIGAADGVLVRSPIGRGVRQVIEMLAPEVLSPPRRADAAGARLLSTDALLDRVARDPSDAGDLFEALLERGLTSDEIATAVAKRCQSVT